MIARPESPIATAVSERFPGESTESFESALARVHLSAPRSGLTARLRRLLGRDRYNRNSRRSVAFDGFRSNLFDEKIERDRRYGSVYSVTEGESAYLVRLEMPRRLPDSALKEAWRLADAMPDYSYSLQLDHQVLSIRASAPNETVRRLAYVSSSFPADFQTRVEFAQAISGFVHRLRDKILEVLVFKRDAPVGQST
ncbi:MAG: hypothetical protein ACREQC_14620 [Candidatus Binataceae bacterium]